MVYKEVHQPAYLRIYDECVASVKKTRSKRYPEMGGEKPILQRYSDSLSLVIYWSLDHSTNITTFAPQSTSVGSTINTHSWAGRGDIPLRKDGAIRYRILDRKFIFKEAMATQHIIIIVTSTVPVALPTNQL